MRWNRLFCQLLLGLAAAVVVLVQLGHPWLHPREVIDPGADSHAACAISHAAIDLPVVLAPFGLATAVFTQVSAPLPWLGHPYFIHRLAPRPPPTASLSL